MSQMDVIRELEDEISSLQAKGFPLKAITEIFAKRGVQMTPAKLSTYLSRVRQEKSKTV
jgi:DNA-binding transcriptional MerR regulator